MTYLVSTHGKVGDGMSRVLTQEDIIQHLESVTQNMILSRYEVDMLFFPQELAVLRQKVITCLLGIIELKGGE